MSTYDGELLRTRADTTLRMYEGLLGTLSFNVAYARLLRDASGISSEGYEAIDFESREYVLAQGRLALLKAARTSRRAYDALPRNSRQRSDVLLRGAAKLGIKTDWPGWSEYPEWGLVTDYNRGTPLRSATREEWQRTADILAGRDVPGWYTGAWEEDGRAVYVEGGPGE
jgi:hypothetical protein